MSSILVVDADERLAELIARFLHGKGHQVVCANSASEAIRSIQHVEVDLMILDVLTCVIEEREAREALVTHTRLQAIPTLLLTYPGSSEETSPSYASLLKVENIAQLYKPFELSELERLASALLKGSKVEPSLPTQGTLNAGPISLDPRTFKVNAGRGAMLLTPREFDLLRYLMEHVGEVLSSERLLQEVWKGNDFADSPEVVRWHIKNIRAKINLSAGKPVEIIQTVPRHGYTILEDVKPPPHADSPGGS